ncbi:glycosyl hydrolase [Maribacter sp. CXY002]|uniref:glycosyl hydrolase n=1 Tax=Maribacter luteocoastalis TaxID=3407671 RepID=UPI003B66CC10
MKFFILKYVFCIILFSCINAVHSQKDSVILYDEDSRVKPWTRWWWMGSAVDKQNIQSTLQSYSKAGLGGVEITPIYGVQGEDANNIPFLSQQWLGLLDFTIKTAGNLGMQVDMNLGAGWPYGGPQVTIDNAATRLLVDSLKVSRGKRVNEILMPTNPKDTLGATLNYVLAYGSNGKYIDLTSLVKDGRLQWKAKKDDYTVYKVFTGKTGQMVKRAAPGGEGYTVDHYSNKALEQYVTRFDAAFATSGKGLRSIFNDSYEVYETDFTPDFFIEFERRRGYDLKPQLQKLLSKTDNELNNRIKSDYRETLGDLLLTEFDIPWTNWANQKGFKTRLQAHGSPGNLIDYYASADIPECETFGSMPYDIKGFRREIEDIRQGDADPVILKFSSSAAHVSGKPLVSSETFTWLRDHFKTALSQTKPEAEDLLLNGVNHIFLHGSTYSPERAAWPGWKFYASVNFNENNTIWEDAPSLFSYIQNCQKLLQKGKPDNEILLYWPIHDVWDNYLKGDLFFQFKIHSLNEWLHGTSFYTIAKELAAEGYLTDFISDRFIEQLSFENGQLMTPGGRYMSLIVPDTDKMPLPTLEKLIQLKKQGASIIFDGLPESVPGFADYQKKNNRLEKIIAENENILKTSKTIFEDLTAVDIHPETIVTSGLKYIRRDIDGKKNYFLVNHTGATIKGSFPFQIKSNEIALYDPLTGKEGIANSYIKDGQTFIQLNIPSGASIFLKENVNKALSNWQYFEELETEYVIKGDWDLTFLKGGPELPKKKTIQELDSWTKLGEKEVSFSGTAQYEIVFTNPDATIKYWKLKLGEVRESAKVWLNDTYLGTLWANPFEMQIMGLKEGDNKLRIEVTNLPANRIRAKELRGEEWKIFKEINMVNKDYKKFDATLWDPMPSGLIGPVTLTPLKTKDEN